MEKNNDDYKSNGQSPTPFSQTYFHGTKADLRIGDVIGRERIYLVEPIGPIEDDPDLTDKKFPGNPTKSYRSQHPFKIVGEITIWQGHTLEQVKAMKAGLAKLKEQGINSLND